MHEPSMFWHGRNEQLRVFLRILLVGSVIVVFATGVACTQQRFLDFWKRAPASAVKSVGAGLTPLTKEQVLEQLRGIDVEPAAAAEASASTKPFLLCDLEVASHDSVVSEGEFLRVNYQANGEDCPRSWYQQAPARLENAKGSARFEFELWCPGSAAVVKNKSLKAGDFFAHQSFDATGQAEAACLQQNDGKSRFLLRTVRSYSMDILDNQDPSRKASYTYKSTLEADNGSGGGCEVRRADAGGSTITQCSYRSLVEQGEHYSFRAAEQLRIQTVAVAHHLEAKPGARFYVAGRIELNINNWRGILFFRNGDTAPEIELSDGRTILRARVNGAFTEALP